MKRSSLNFIVDFISFLDLLVLACTGFIIEFILPPGTGGGGGGGFGYRGGRGPAAEVKSLWSMTRHEWGKIHFHLAILFLILMLVHLVLHWTWIKCYVKSLFGSKKSTRTNDGCP